MMMLASRLVAAVLLQSNAALAAAIDPAHAANITVYHVNEHSFGAVPINMNTSAPNPTPTTPFPLGTKVSPPALSPSGPAYRADFPLPRLQ